MEETPEAGAGCVYERKEVQTLLAFPGLLSYAPASDAISIALNPRP